MKRNSLLLLLLLTTLGIQAATKMIVHPKSGDNVEVLFSDKPVATYNGSEMVITTEKTTLTFQISEIDYADFAEYTTAIDEPVTVLPAKAGTTRVYDTNGRLVRNVAEGSRLSLNGLPAGLYIVKTNNLTYKISKR